MYIIFSVRSARKTSGCIKQKAFFDLQTFETQTLKLPKVKRGKDNISKTYNRESGKRLTHQEIWRLYTWFTALSI